MCIVREQLAGAERQIISSKRQLNETQLAHEKLTNETSRTEADFLAQAVAVEEGLNVERARIERLERGIAGRLRRGNSC